MEELKVFLETYPYKTDTLAKECRVNPSRIRQLVKALEKKNLAVKFHDKWRFKSAAVHAVRNRSTELIPFL